MSILLGLACIGASIALLVALRARDGRPHPLMLRAGMEVVAPLVILAMAVSGLALVFTGGYDLWQGM